MAPLAGMCEHVATLFQLPFRVQKAGFFNDASFVEPTEMNVVAIAIDDEPSSKEIADALERVLADPEVGGNFRRSALLRHLVDAVLSGEPARLKGTSIAIEVFGRDVDFDPQTDAIVRTEARRLRQALASYYQGAGLHDPLLIVVPKGSYVPRFERRAPIVAVPQTPDGMDKAAEPHGSLARPPSRQDKMVRLIAVGLLVVVAAAAALAVAWTQPGPPERRVAIDETVPVMLVVPFDASGASEEIRTLASGLTARLIDDLMRFPDFRLYSFGDSLNQSDAIIAASDDELAYIVRGIVRSDGRNLTVVARLAQAKDGRVLWSETYSRPLEPAALLAMQSDIAAEIASTIGQPYGIVRNAVAARLSDADGAEMESFSCVMQAYSYRHSNRRDLYAPVRACLKDAVERDAGYAEAWAMLAYARLDAVRFGYGPEAETAGPAPYAQANAAAMRALALSPDSTQAIKALSLIEHYAGRYEESQNLARRALALNPNDPDALAQLGWRLSVRGNFEEGIPYLSRAIERSVSPPPWYYHPIALERLIANDMQGMLAAAERAALDDSSVSDALLAIAHAGLGDAGAAADALERMARKWPLLGRDPASAFRRHQLREDLVTALVDGLRGAGWQPPS
jgi:TolB-like protein